MPTESQPRVTHTSGPPPALAQSAQPSNARIPSHPQHHIPYPQHISAQRVVPAPHHPLPPNASAPRPQPPQQQQPSHQPPHPHQPPPQQQPQQPPQQQQQQQQQQQHQQQQQQPQQQQQQQPQQPQQPQQQPQQPPQQQHARPIHTSQLQYHPMQNRPPMPMNQPPPPPQSGNPRNMQYLPPNTYMNNDFGPPIPPNQQQYMNAPYMYQPAFYQMPNPNMPAHPQGPPPPHVQHQQGQHPMNHQQRNQRPPFHHPQVHSQHQMPRTPQQSHISIPRQAKKVLSIVDPKTNQAVKVEKPSAAPPAAPKPSAGTIKIEPPRPTPRRPLSLEADPADVKSESKKEADTQVSDAKDETATDKTDVPAVETTPADGAVSKDAKDESKPCTDASAASTNGGDAQKATATSATLNQPGESQQVKDEETPVKKVEKHLETPSPTPAVEHGEKEMSSVSSKAGGETTTPAGDVTSQRVLKEASIDVDAGHGAVDAPTINPKSKATDAVDAYDPMENKQPNTKSNDDNLDGMTSDVSSSTFADVRSDSTDGPLPNNYLNSKPSDDHASTSSSTSKPVAAAAEEGESSAQPSESNSVDTAASDKNITESSKAAEPATKEEKTSDVKVTEEVNEDPASKLADSDEKKVDAESETVDDAEANGTKDEDSSNSQDETDFGPVFKFSEGERRVYPPAFVLSMKVYANPKRMNEMLAATSSIDANSGGGHMKKSVSRNEHMSRAGSGSMEDPRRRTFGHGTTQSFNLPGTVRAPKNGAYNLDDARRQPPPMLKTQGSGAGRDGDPRGRRTQSGMPHGRHGNGPPSRQFNTPVDPFINQPPVEKLKRSENAWKRDRESEDEKTRKVKEVRSLLNKLTLEKFDKIFQQIVDIDISSMDTLVGIVREIFEKPLYEPKFSSMYAELCRRIDNTIQPILTKKDPSGSFNFRKILLNNCKEEFTRFANSSANKENDPSSKDSASTEKGKGDNAEKKEDKKEEGPGDKKADENKQEGGEKKTKEMTPQEREEEELKVTIAKRRMLANVRFIGELFLKDLLRETIIHKNCIQKLLTLASENYEEDVLEAVCKLISKTGEKLSSNQGAIEHINKYFAVLNGYTSHKRVPARIRFMIQDLVDQRRNGWKVRREESGAKTIAEIHKDIAEKERAKQEAQSAMRDRRNRGGRGSMNGDRGSQPRIAMTMASASKGSNTGMSRTNLLLERSLNRSSNSSTTSVRLGPSKSGLGVGSGPSLRPQRAMSGGSGSRFSALGSDSQERTNSNESRNSTGTASSLDPRRPKSIAVPSGNKPDASIATRRPSSTRVTAPAPVQEPKVELMEPEALKKKTRGILEEYLTLNMVDEVVACLEEEVKKPNYPGFVDNFVKITMEGKKDAVPKLQKLIISLISTKKLPASLFLATFKKFGPELPNIDVDCPLATELFGGLVAAAASSEEFRQLPDAGGKFGLGFVRTIFTDSADKVAAAKMILMVCKGAQMFAAESTSADAAQQVAKDVYVAWDMDLVAEITAADSFGLRFFELTFKRSGVDFLLPHFKLETELRSKLSSKPSEEDVVALLKTACNADGELPLPVITVALRAAMDEVIGDGGDSIMKKISSVLEITAKALVTLLKKKDEESLSSNAQLEGVFATQAYFAGNSSRVEPASLLPGTVVGVFMKLYDVDLIEEDAFRKWKADTEHSGKPGKEMMITNSAEFFTWLDKADEE